MSKTQQIIETPVAGVFPEPVGEMQRRSSWLSNKFTENSCNGANENMNIWVPNYLKWRKFEREMQITQDCGKHSLGEGVKALGCSSLNCGRVKRGVSGSSNETDTRFIRYFVPGCFSRCICINYFVWCLLQVSSTPCSVIDSLAAPKCFLQECAASTLGKRSKGSAPGWLP